MYRNFLRAMFVLLLVASCASAQQPAVKQQKIESVEHQKVKATITYEIRTTNFATTRWMVFLPAPQVLPSQSGVKLTYDPAGKFVTEKSPLERTVRFFDVSVPNPKPGTGFTTKMTVEATLHKRDLVDLKEGERPPRVLALSMKEKKYYTSPTTHTDFNSADFKDWSDAKKLRKEKNETALDFAARALEVIRKSYSYNYDPDEDKRASVVCKQEKTDCGGMAYLFVATMRANDIPARVLVGRIAKPREPGSDRTKLEYDRPHVRAELYVASIGWVPVDPSYAQAAKDNPVTDFIGHDPGDLLVLHVDIDLQLPFPDKTRETVGLQCTPNYWVNGKGTFDATFGPSGWELKATPIEKK